MTKKIFLISLISLIVGLAYFSCDKRSERSTINMPPVANAGHDTIVVLPLDSVALDGSGSNDPDGQITSYVWTKISGPASFTISNSALAKVAIKNLVLGVYKVELKVKDDGGLSSSDTIQIVVNNSGQANKLPVANAGADKTIILPINSAPLDGSASTDPDNNITGYQWTKISGPSTFSLASANALQTQVLGLVEGAYQFELTVWDAGGLFSKDTVRISVLSGATKEIIFTDLTWINQCYDPTPGACWINGDAPSYGFYIKDTANILTDSARATLGVWLKMDTSGVWEQVPNNCWKFPDPYPQTNFTYCLTSEGVSICSWFFSSENLAGRKAEVKIRF